MAEKEAEEESPQTYAKLKNHWESLSLQSNSNSDSPSKRLSGQQNGQARLSRVNNEASESEKNVSSQANRPDHLPRTSIDDEVDIDNSGPKSPHKPLPPRVPSPRQINSASKPIPIPRARTPAPIDTSSRTSGSFLIPPLPVRPTSLRNKSEVAIEQSRSSFDEGRRSSLLEKRASKISVEGISQPLDNETFHSPKQVTIIDRESPSVKIRSRQLSERNDKRDSVDGKNLMPFSLPPDQHQSALHSSEHNTQLQIPVRASVESNLTEKDQSTHPQNIKLPERKHLGKTPIRSPSKETPPYTPITKNLVPQKPLALPPRSNTNIEDKNLTVQRGQSFPLKDVNSRNKQFIRDNHPLQRTQSMPTGGNKDVPAKQKVPTDERPLDLDFSQTNRKPPMFEGFDDNVNDIVCANDPKVIAITGRYICAAYQQVKVWDARNGKLIFSQSFSNDKEREKVTSACFLQSKTIDSSILWLGTMSGELLSVNFLKDKDSLVDRNRLTHMKTVSKICMSGSTVWTIEEDGKVCCWQNIKEDGLFTSAQTFRISGGRFTSSNMIDSELWVTTVRQIHIFSPSPGNNSCNQTSISTPSKILSPITSGCLVDYTDEVFFGHENGTLSIFSRTNRTLNESLSINRHSIVSMVIVFENLWVAYNTGHIVIYNIKTRKWVVCNEWIAHKTSSSNKSAIMDICFDQNSLWKIGRLQVITLGLQDGLIKFWDGLLMKTWIEEQMQIRQSKYCSFRPFNVHITTWNVGASKPEDFVHNNGNFVETVLNGVEPPDLIVFGFQEIIDLEDKALTAKTILGKKRDPLGDLNSEISQKRRSWESHLAQALQINYYQKAKYKHIYSANMVGLLLCIFIKENEFSGINDLATSNVATGFKVGFSERYGNKGSVSVRFSIDDTSFCFINCHLAAGQNNIKDRLSDLSSILESDGLPTVDKHDAAIRYANGGDGSMCNDHEICFLQGDLNYRINLGRDQVLDRLRKHMITQLLEYDQCTQQMRKEPGMRLRSFKEGQISFSPTYKYDVGTDNWDSSEKRRVPAWCDRIFYRGVVPNRVELKKYYRSEGIRLSDHRPVSALFTVQVKKIISSERAKIYKDISLEFQNKVQKLLQTRE